LLLVAFLLVDAPNCHLSLVLASVVQSDAVNCNISYLHIVIMAVGLKLLLWIFWTLQRWIDLFFQLIIRSNNIISKSHPNSKT